VIRVLLVDDHASFRELLALRLAIESDLDVAAEAGSLAEARALLQEAACGADVALVDLDLPDGSGVDLVRDIRVTNPGATVVVLTASFDQHRHADAVAAGASGVLSKTVKPAAIVEAIRRACAGEALLSPREAIELLRLGDRRREAERATSRPSAG
jgi:DNA-binding NarL/FixJ family response regulator